MDRDGDGKRSGLQERHGEDGAEDYAAPDIGQGGEKHAAAGLQRGKHPVHRPPERSADDAGDDQAVSPLLLMSRLF